MRRDPTPTRSHPAGPLTARAPDASAASVGVDADDGASVSAAAAGDERPRDLVAGLEKGLQVIEAFGHERPRLTIAEVAQRTGLTRAAARRYLITLTHLGFVCQDRRMFALTPKVLRLAQSYMEAARLPRIVQPELYRLSMELQEASSAGTLDGADVLCIAALSAGRLVSPTLQPGTRVPAYCTANGRVLLAARPPADVEAWLAGQALLPLTPHTQTQPAQLAGAIARVRLDGHAMVDQELEPGLRTLAVPLKNYRGDTVAALNLSVHASRLSMQALLERGLPPLQRAQAALRQLL